MSCPASKCLCERLVLSQEVTFEDNTLIINIPAGSYSNGCKYCIIVAQEIPDETTISANVVITIGDDTETTYPLVNCNCSNVNACQIETRTRYSAVVHTDIQSGVFKLTGKTNCNTCNRAARAIPVETTAAAGAEG